MRIVLNSELVKNTIHRPRNGTEHAQDLARIIGGSWQGAKALNYIGSEFYPDMEQTHLGFLSIMAHAYSQHEKLRIAPHDLWFIVLTEIAKIINKSPETYRDLFTRSSDKIEITVQTDDVTTIDPAALMDQLVHLVPTDTTIFLPRLSTMDSDVNVAFMAVFCDMVKEYYSYSTFMCGIPEIELTGTEEDWSELVYCVASLAVNVFVDRDPKATKYLIQVGDLFDNILNQVKAGEADVDFWKDIFRSKNVGSGGELLINGWITKLFVETHQVPKLENFTGTFGVIPYTNLNTGRRFKAAHGSFTHRRDENDFIYASYDRVIFEDMSK